MFEYRCSIVVALMGFASLGGCTGDSPDAPSPLCEYMQCGSLDGHDYAVYRPAAVTADAPWLVLLHGANITSAYTEAQWGGRAFADRYGYILVIPHANGGAWNSGGDVAFVPALVDRLQADYGKPSSLFVAGWSNGSVLSQMIACDHADRVSAVVSFAGELTTGRKCAPSAPVGVALIHGSSDSVVPIEGSWRFGTMSLADNFKLWQQLNGCSADVTVGPYFLLEFSKSARTTTAQNCSAPVQQTIAYDGQHQSNWDMAVLHPYLHDFFTRAVQARQR